jgi:hypothetical protein
MVASSADLQQFVQRVVKINVADQDHTTQSSLYNAAQLVRTHPQPVERHLDVLRCSTSARMQLLGDLQTPQIRQSFPLRLAAWARLLQIDRIEYESVVAVSS